MSTPRLPTVYDLSGLRLHRDGSIVRQTDKNLKYRRSKLSIRDSRGRWIAKDAGGLANVPHKYKARSIFQHDESQGDDADGGARMGYIEKGKERAVEEITDVLTEERAWKTQRAKVRAEKRRKFGEDFDFLAPTSSRNDTSRSSSVPLSSCDPPSSDLLKCIHYLASRYYEDRGQLTNSSRQFRKEKKARRLARLSKGCLAHRVKSGSRRRGVDGDDFAVGSVSSSEAEAEYSAKGTDLSSGSDRDIEAQEYDTDAESSFPKMGTVSPSEPKVSIKRKQNRITDMYKTMDGSALMVIGMLLQEHVSECLQPRISPGDQDREGEVIEAGTEGEAEPTRLLEPVGLSS